MSINISLDAMSAMNPTTVGYLTDFSVLGEKQVSLASDLSVFFPADIKPTYAPLGEPYQMATGMYLINVIAFLELFKWSGISGEEISFSCYMSSPNANLLRMLEPPCKVTFGWWIASYDSETQKWVEGMHPKNPERMSGLLKALSVGNEPSEPPLYLVSFEIVPQ